MSEDNSHLCLVSVLDSFNNIVPLNSCYDYLYLYISLNQLVAVHQCAFFRNCKLVCDVVDLFASDLYRPLQLRIWFVVTPQNIPTSGHHGLETINKPL
jgi:hypothetical protein